MHRILERSNTPLFGDAKRADAIVKWSIGKPEGTRFTTDTPFDDVISLVDRENIISLAKIVERFKIKKELAMEWGRILSESGLIDFYQPAFGDPEFRKKGINIPKSEIKTNVGSVPRAYESKGLMFL